VNWVWALDLTIYHAAYSIGTAILVAELMFPSRRHHRWVGKWGQVVLGSLLAADVLAGCLFFAAEGVPNTPPYRPALGPYAGAAALVVLLIVVARYLPAGAGSAALPARQPAGGPAARPVWFWLTGFLGTLVFFFDSWVLPHMVPYPAATWLMTAACVVGVTWLLVWMSGGGAAWTDRQRLALAAGPLTFFMLFDGLIEFTGAGPKNTRGMLLVGAAILVTLLLLRRSIRRRLAANVPATDASGEGPRPKAEAAG
jgi:hypothetical protein